MAGEQILNFESVDDPIVDDPESYIQEPEEADLPLEEDLLPVIPLNIVNGGILTPRDYQIECVHKTYYEFRKHRSVLDVLATGLGKTIIAAEIALLWPETNGRVLFIAHRKELIVQGAEKIGLHLDQACGIEMAEQSEARQGRTLTGKSKVLVGSVQTLSRLNRLKPYDPHDFGLVIFDEAHHCTASTYKTIFGYFQQNRQCRFLGITATPDRADGALLGEVFETCAYKMDILDGINSGWLVPIHQRYVVIEGLDFSSCRTTAGDLNEKDLERAMAGANADEVGSDDAELTDEQIEARKKQERMLHAVADPTIREADGRPGIVFCVTIDHAEKMAAVFRRYEVTAEAVTMRTTPDMREEHVKAFKAGRLQFLIGVGVFTEGFDAPNAAVIAIARPTKSRALYTQMVGRATRPDPEAIKSDDAEERRTSIEASGKPFATVLDFVGNSGRHKLISTADILGDAFPEDLREEVISSMRRNGETADMTRELAEAQARRETMARLKAEEDKRRREEAQRRYQELMARQIEEDRLRRLKAEAQYTAREVDPFGDRAHHQASLDAPRGGSTEKQVKYLTALGVKYEEALGYGTKQAGIVINKLKALTGAKYRVFFGKHKGKSLEEAGQGFVWWVKNTMGDGDLRNELLRNIEIMECEKAGVPVPQRSGDNLDEYF